jgi:hypothetical protein
LVWYRKVFQFSITSRCSKPHIALQEVLTWHDMHLSSLRDVSLGPRLVAIKYVRGGTFRNPGPESDHILCLDIETLEILTVPHNVKHVSLLIHSLADDVSGRGFADCNRLHTFVHLTLAVAARVIDTHLGRSVRAPFFPTQRALGIQRASPGRESQSKFACRASAM